MTTQPEALRLADRLDLWGDQNDLLEAAAELRRLHQFAEDLIGRATAAEAALQMTKATHALKIAAVEAQRDALLRVLKDCEIALRTVAKSDDEFVMARHQVREVRAVIKAVEGEKK